MNFLFSTLASRVVFDRLYFEAGKIDRRILNKISETVDDSKFVLKAFTSKNKSKGTSEISEQCGWEELGRRSMPST
jgi:hypothetical protein